MTTQTFHRILHSSSAIVTPTRHDGLLAWGGTLLAFGVLVVLVGSLLASTSALVTGTLMAVAAAFLLSCRDLHGRRRSE